MRRYTAIFALLLFTLSVLLNACRPPELEQAVIDYNAGRFDNAYEEAKEASEKYPDNEEAWYYLGEIEGRKGNIKAMIDAFDKSMSLKNTFQQQIELSKKNYYGKAYNDGVSAYNSMIKIEDKESPEAKKAMETVIKNFKDVLLIKNDYIFKILYNRLHGLF